MRKMSRPHSDLSSDAEHDIALLRKGAYCGEIVERVDIDTGAKVGLEELVVR